MPAKNTIARQMLKTILSASTESACSWTTARRAIIIPRSDTHNASCIGPGAPYRPGSRRGYGWRQVLKDRQSCGLLLFSHSIGGIPAKLDPARVAETLE